MSIQQEKVGQSPAKHEEACPRGGEERIEKQHAKDKYTARERTAMLLDEGSFEEIGMLVQRRYASFGMEKKKFLGDSVVVGSGTIDGRLIYVFAQDLTVIGGALGEMLAVKTCKVVGLAMTMGTPCIDFSDSGGARIQEAINALCGYGEVFERSILASDVTPQISGIFGPRVDGVIYSPALTNFNIMIRSSNYIFLTGSKMVKTVTDEGATREELGGVDVHTSKSGVTYFTVGSNEAGLQLIRQLLSLLPQSNMEEPPFVACGDPANRCEGLLNKIVLDSSNRTYDMCKAIGAIVDHDGFLKVHRDYTRSIIVGFTRFNGQSVDIVTNQSEVMADSLDRNSSRKTTHSVHFCDSFNILIITLVGVPDFLPGTGQEYNTVITHGTKLLYAYGEATVPKITVVLRKAYGGAYIVVDSKHLRVDINYTWPSTEIAVMGLSEAVEVVFARRVKTNDGPAKAALERKQEYHDAFADPYNTASYGYTDDVIEPRDTHFRIIHALQQLRTKRQMPPAKKHNNVLL